MTPVLCLGRASLVVACLCTLLVPARAHAVQGLNLRWVECLGDGGVQNQSFACDSNTGVRAMHGSFVLASDMAQVIGTEIILQLASDSPALPDWWQFRNLGTCRQSALSAVFFPTATAVACVEWSDVQAVGGIGGYCTTTFTCVNPPPPLNVAVIKLVAAVPPTAAADVTGGVEYYDFTLNISNVKTVGAGSCAGCAVPVCIVLNSINVVALDNVEQRFITTPTVPGSNYVTWQGGGSPSNGGVVGCPAATATRRSTWGSLKTLYR